MSRDLSVRSQLGALAMTRHQERGLVKQAKALQRDALEVRAEDVARGYIARGRIRDIRRLSFDALEAGSEIGACLESEAARRPFFARELADIASTGARGLKTELAYFIEEGH